MQVSLRSTVGTSKLERELRQVVRQIVTASVGKSEGEDTFSECRKGPE